MKKLISIVLTLLLVGSLALAEADFTSMTDDELHALVDGARIELTKRELSAAADTVILEQDGVTVYLTGENRTSSDGKYIYVGVVIINENDFTITLMNNATQVNGWMSFMNNMAGSVAPGARAKGELQIKVDGTDAASIEEVQEVTLVVDIFDKDTPTTVSTTDPITVHFNAN